MSEPPSSEPSTSPGSGTPPRVRFDTSQLKSSYANVCNGSSSREEIVINFGVNEGWERGTDAVDIKLHHRIVMSPLATKRLYDMLSTLLAEHEQRYGSI